jgi:hypothetical protein
MSTVVSTQIDKDQLALALARNQVGEKLPIADVLHMQNITEAQAETYLNDPMFVAAVKRMAKELTENGFSFEAKCRILAEAVLKTAYSIVQDDEAPSAVRMKGIENLVEWGGLKPKNTNNQNNAAGPGFTIQIVVPQAVQAAAVAAGVAATIRTPVTIEQDDTDADADTDTDTDADQEDDTEDDTEDDN